MGKDSPSPPAAPDYAGAAQAQGAANIEAARLSARMANPNIIGPYGTQTVSYGQPSFDQLGFDKAMQAYGSGQGIPLQGPGGEQVTNANPPGQPARYQYKGAGGWTDMPAGVANQRAPTREDYTQTINGDQPTVTQTLTPSAQATLDAQQRVQRSLAGLGEQGIGTAQKVLGTPFSFGGPAIQTSLGNAGQIPQAPDLSSYGQASGLSNMLSSLPKQPPKSYTNPSDFEGLTFASKDSAFGGANYKEKPMFSYAAGTSREEKLRNEAPYMTRDNYEQNLNYLREMEAPTQMQQPGALPFVQQNPQAPELSVYGMAGAGPSAGQYGFAQGGLNTSNVAAMPVNAGMTAQQAIMSRLDPSIARNRVSTETQLINQGLRPGGEAYNNAINLLGQQENDQRTQAVLQGIGLDTAANAQGFGQALQAGQYGNQAVAQNFGLGQAANASQNAAVGQNQQAALAQYQAQLGGQQQGFGQQVTQRQLGNQAISQNQQTALAQQQAAMGAQNQQFNQGLAGAQFANTAQQNALAQALQGRQMTLNEITALMSGSQIQNPTFQPYQGQSVAPAPVAQAAAQQAQFGQNIYNQQMGQANANTAGLYSLGGAALGGFFGGPAGAAAGASAGRYLAR